ncbi:MAG TPA: Dabb family protein [Limnochordia bacterium]|nr:Dabb family protein [Limnochordia bacterium]
MVEHIVLFKMKPDSTPEQKEELIRRLRGMAGKIEGMVSLSAGETFTDRHKGYTVGLVVRFTDKAALERYGPHPVHVPVKEYVAQVCEDVIAVDYEID